MHGIAVALLTEDRERLAVLRHRLETSQGGRIVFTYVGFPANASDPILRQIQDVHADIVLVEIDPRAEARALDAIELIRSNTPQAAIFAIGELRNPSTIVAAMRAGVTEYLEGNATSEAMAEALSRFANTRSKTRATAGRARVFMVTNAKGGAGSTTVAVNTAIALQEAHGGVLLVDFAPLGHAALHLNLRPAFGVFDALQNLHRLDASLLAGLLTQCKGGLQLLAAPSQPFTLSPTAAELARLFDLLVSVPFRGSGLLQSRGRHCPFAWRVVECDPAGHPGRRSFALECRPHAAISGGGRRPRPGSPDSQPVQENSRLHRRGCRESYRLQTALEVAQQLPGNRSCHRQRGTVAFGDQDIGKSFRGLATALADAAPSAEGSLDLVTSTIRLTASGNSRAVF